MSQRFVVRPFPFFQLMSVALLTLSTLMLAAGWRVSGQSAGSTVNQELPALELNQTVERQLAGGETHSYRLKLSAGQYIKVEVFQYWISVELRLFDPDGKLVVEFKLHNEDAQTEMLSAIAEKSGDFIFEIKARGHGGLHSNCKITYVKRQMATPQDRLLDAADRMQLEAYALARQGKWDEAINLSERAIGEYEKVYGAAHQELIEPLKLLEVLLMFRGDGVARERVSLRILAIQEKVFGREHLEVTSGLLSLAFSYWNQEKEAQAKTFLERALEIREKLLKPDDMRIAQILSDLGNLHKGLSEFTQAQLRLQRAMAIAEKALGPASNFVIMRWNDLAELAAVQGDYTTAVSFWERGINSAEKFSPKSPVYAAMTVSLGQLQMDLGNYSQAKELFQHALPLFEEFWGLESGNSAGLLHLMGKLSFEQGELQRAEQIHQQSLSIHEKILGSEHIAVAASLNELAKVFSAQRRFDEAEAAFQRARQIYDKVYSDKDWRWGIGLRDWGKLYQVKGDYAKAEQLIRRALISYEHSLGANHPYAFEVHCDLMALCVAQGRFEEALVEQQRAATISEFNLSRTLLIGSETQKLRFLEKFGSEVDGTLSLHVRSLPHNPQALQLAFETLLRRKGRALDEMGQVIRLLRQRAGGDGTKLFNQLSDKLSQLSVLTTSGSDARNRESYLERIKQVNEEIEKLQATLSERSREFRTTTQPVTLEALRAALPIDTALIEFARFKSIDEKNRGKFEYQYAAYILLPDGTLRWALLGKAEEIERVVEAWRNALDPQRKPSNGQAPADVRKLARKLDALVMQPVRAQLGSARQVLLAPDGDLNLIPFAALLDERGQYLIEDYLFIYLTSGRDLLRLQVKHESQPEKLIFAVSDFDGQTIASSSAAKPSPGVSDARGGRLSASTTMATIRFNRLKFARAEGEAVQRAVPLAKLYTDGQATETFLKQVHRPYFLHIVTHGFSLPDGDQKLENPLLRSGLALAGANQRRSGEDDGLLTAFEAAALDLWGTKLVVLSACGTGLGEVKNGEGVFGLRRALALAGAETQLATLWDIDDEVTGDLMKKYYQRLQRGEGRAEALRQVQLEMLRGKANRHPRFWASFVTIGEWANLKGER